MSRSRPLAYVPPEAPPAFESPLEALRARTDAGDVLGRIAEAGAAKAASRGTVSRKLTIELSGDEHANLAEHARRAGLSMRDVIRLCLESVLRKP